MLRLKQVELKVKGMSCNHCEMRVKKALEAVPGVHSANADHTKGNVIIETNDEVLTESLVRAVNETGLYEIES